VARLAEEIETAKRRALKVDEGMEINPLYVLSNLDSQFRAAAEFEVKTIAKSLLSLAEPVLTDEQVLDEMTRRLIQVTQEMGCSRSTSTLSNLANDCRAKAWGDLVNHMTFHVKES
jgi:hypothetical protein